MNSAIQFFNDDEEDDEDEEGDEDELSSTDRTQSQRERSGSLIDGAAELPSEVKGLVTRREIARQGIVHFQQYMETNIYGNLVARSRDAQQMATELALHLEALRGVRNVSYGANRMLTH